MPLIAIIAGAAVSGEASTGDTPRLGLNWAYSPGGPVHSRAARDDIEYTKSLDQNFVSGLEAFAEYGFNNLFEMENGALDITPRVFWGREIGASQQKCGVVLSADLVLQTKDRLGNFSVSLDLERREATESFGFGIDYTKIIGAGELLLVLI